MTTVFQRSCTLPYPSKVVFDWHGRPGAFERLNPPWRPVEVLENSGSIRDGARVKIKIPILGPVGIPWELEHRYFIEGVQFCDTQVTGPFAAWSHLHKVIALDNNSSSLTDTISYELPLIARPLQRFFEAELDRLFRFRHAVMTSDLRLHDRFAAAPRKTFLITGSSGLIGKALCSYLSTAGHTVIRLVRREPRSLQERKWIPEEGFLPAAAFDGVDVVIHLAGENIASGRWTPALKKKLQESRVLSSALLARTLRELPHKPSLFMAASAVGFYGDTLQKTVDEHSSVGSGFLAELASEWESSYSALADVMRVASLRFGTVISPRGGALQKMLPAFRAGVGGRLGSGKHYMSWIALQDVLGAIEHIVCTKQLSGPINLVAPTPCTNAEFTRSLGKVLHRPSMCHVPANALRLIFGEMADALLLASSAAIPSKLHDTGYSFECPTLEDAFRFECGL